MYFCFLTHNMEFKMTFCRAFAGKSILLPFLLFGFAIAVDAQDNGKSLPNDLCDSVLTGVKNGDPDALKRYSGLYCGEKGVEIVQTLLTQMTTNGRLGRYFEYVTPVGGVAKDSRIFEQAISIVVDRSASYESRLAATHILGKYYVPSTGFGLGLSEMMRSDFKCSFVPLDNSNSPGKMIKPLPQDYLIRTARAFESIYRDKSNPKNLREATQCIRLAMYSNVSFSMPDNAVSLRHICETNYVIKNKLDEVLYADSLAIVRNDTAISLGFQLQPQDSIILRIEGAGKLALVWDGRKIFKLDMREKACTERPRATRGTDAIKTR